MNKLLQSPAIGTWKLNLEQSKYPAGAAPKSETRTYAVGAGGITTTVTGIAADGPAVSQSATLTCDGKVVGHSTRTISGKGKVLNLSSAIRTARGGMTHQIAVYDKQ